VVIGVATSSGGASGPSHEEGEVVKRAIHGGPRRPEIEELVAVILLGSRWLVLGGGQQALWGGGWGGGLLISACARVKWARMGVDMNGGSRSSVRRG
jgi:hypothetical protein